MLSLYPAALVSALLAFALTACNDPESVANQKYVTAAERVTAAQRSTNPIERHKLLMEAQMLVDVILKEHGSTAAAVRLSANDKIGGLTRGDLAKALTSASAHPDICLAAPTVACLKAALYQYVEQAPATKPLPDKQAEQRRAAAERDAILAIGALQALNEPIAQRLKQSKGTNTAQYYLTDSFQVTVGRGCELALALYRAHGIEHAKAFLTRNAALQPCDVDGLAFHIRHRLGIDDTKALLELLRTITPNTTADALTLTLSGLQKTDCANAQSHITRLLPLWPRDRLTQLVTNISPACQIPVTFFSTLYDQSTSPKDKQAIATWIFNSAKGTPRERYDYMLKSELRDRWDYHYEQLRIAANKRDAALVTTIAANLRRLPLPVYRGESAAVPQLQNQISNAIIAGTLPTALPQLINTYILTPTYPIGSLLAHCNTLLNTAWLADDLPTEDLIDSCIDVVARATAQKNHTLMVSVVARAAYSVAKDRGASVLQSTLRKWPDNVIATLLSDSGDHYPDVAASLPASTLTRIVPLVTGREQFRIRAHQLVSSIRADSDEWRAAARADENVREYVIAALMKPETIGDGPWRTRALQEMHEQYPYLTYMLAEQITPSRGPPEERLRQLSAIIKTTNIPSLSDREAALLSELARHYIRNRQPLELLRMHAYRAFPSEERVWLLGEAAILMSNK